MSFCTHGACPNWRNVLFTIKCSISWVNFFLFSKVRFFFLSSLPFIRCDKKVNAIFQVQLFFSTFIRKFPVKTVISLGEDEKFCFLKITVSYSFFNSHKFTLRLFDCSLRKKFQWTIFFLLEKFWKRQPRRINFGRPSLKIKMKGTETAKGISAWLVK